MMNSIDMVSLAFNVMFSSHGKQVDKSGKPYFLHPISVALNTCKISDFDPIVFSVALLHDVVEDTSVSLDDLRDMGFSDDIVYPISLLTHSKDITYMEYISNLKSDDVARVVKIADLLHNMDLSRLSNPTKMDIDRVIKRYIPAYFMLMN